jgi:type I restriction enzyme S subunit
VYCHGDAGCSADVLCFAAKTPTLAPYIYSTLYTDKFFDYMVAGSKGTKMPRGDKQQIMQYPVHLPTDTELEVFASIAENILEMIHKNRIANKKLEMTRDSLLPKLMSGELDNSDLVI